jgi:hypothetical protein
MIEDDDNYLPLTKNPNTVLTNAPPSDQYKKVRGEIKGLKKEWD